MAVLRRDWLKIVVWAVVLGLLTTLLGDWGEWDRFPVNLLWRVAIVAVGGLLGLALNFFAGNYVTMGTNVIESMGMVRFGDDTHQKIENSFIFIGSLLGAIAALIFVK